MYHYTLKERVYFDMNEENEARVIPAYTSDGRYRVADVSNFLIIALNPSNPLRTKPANVIAQIPFQSHEKNLSRITLHVKK